MTRVEPPVRSAPARPGSRPSSSATRFQVSLDCSGNTSSWTSVRN